MAETIDVTDATFEQEVLERSCETPVVVDLWAPWCGPCRTLGPIIERVVAETKGAVELAKVNVDENPQISAAFQVQSIPAVYALLDRKVVDGFVGAQPEAQVQEFVARIAGGSVQSEADLLVEAGDEASLRQALEIEADHPLAVLRLAELLVAAGKPDEALGMLQRVPETAETRRVAALARLAVKEGSDEPAGVTKRLDSLLEQVKQDDEARQTYLDLLETMSPEEPERERYRRALASRLF